MTKWQRRPEEYRDSATGLLAYTAVFLAVVGLGLVFAYGFTDSTGDYYGYSKMKYEHDQAETAAKSNWDNWEKRSTEVKKVNLFWDKVTAEDAQQTLSTSEELLAKDLRATYLSDGKPEEQVASMRRLLISGQTAYPDLDEVIVNNIFQAPGSPGGQVKSYLKSLKPGEPWTNEGLRGAVLLESPAPPDSPRTVPPIPSFWVWVFGWPKGLLWWGGDAAIDYVLSLLIKLWSKPKRFWLPTRHDWGWWLTTSVLALPVFAPIWAGHGLFALSRVIVDLPMKVARRVVSGAGAVSCWRKEVTAFNRRERRIVRRAIMGCEAFLARNPENEDVRELLATAQATLDRLRSETSRPPKAPKLLPDMRRVEGWTRDVDGIVAGLAANDELDAEGLGTCHE